MVSYRLRDKIIILNLKPTIKHCIRKHSSDLSFIVIYKLMAKKNQLIETDSKPEKICFLKVFPSLNNMKIFKKHFFNLKSRPQKKLRNKHRTKTHIIFLTTHRV